MSGARSRSPEGEAVAWPLADGLLRTALDADEHGHLAGALRLAGAADYPAVAGLLDVAACRTWLDALAPHIGAPSRPAAASLFAKRHAFLVTGAPLYAMSVFDKGLDASLANVRLDADYADRLWVSRLRLVDDAVLAAPAGAARAAWRAAVVSRVFAHHLAPLWRTVAAAGGIAERILWENTAVRVYGLYEGRMESAGPREQARIAADFDWLRQEAEPAVFGIDYNPLARFDFDKTPVDGRARPVRFRKTCCLYYQVPHAREYCRACPLVKPGRRPPVAFD
jgi:ferric iron reductase protein FhuF